MARSIAARVAQGLGGSPRTLETARPWRGGAQRAPVLSATGSTDIADFKLRSAGAALSDAGDDWLGSIAPYGKRRRRPYGSDQSPLGSRVARGLRAGARARTLGVTASARIPGRSVPDMEAQRRGAGGVLVISNVAGRANLELLEVAAEHGPSRYGGFEAADLEETARISRRSRALPRDGPTGS